MEPNQKNEFLWWKNGLIYQIYPRSFKDSNGDGIGDIRGIIEKIEYLHWLGIDGIWLSPINSSPMFDFGYDISDYREIDPLFGTINDLKELLSVAHDKNIKIILDLVINHTSHLHPWFIESRSSRDNPKRDWYIWHDGKNGKVPNNWKGAFGGSGWEWDDKTEQFYYHSFLKEQPDVNWRNSELKEAIFNEIKYWLDFGIDGFRLDVVNWFIKDLELRNNPFCFGPTPRPYDMQEHIYDRNREETHEILKNLRKLMDNYSERMTVGEVYSHPPGDVKLSATHLGNGEDELNLSFDFSLLFSKFSAKSIKTILEKWYDNIPEKGWPCNVLSNHDQPRAISRYGKKNNRPENAKLLCTLLLTIKGTPFIYYGEEIGMSNIPIKKKEIIDPVGKKYWPFNRGRDPERSPMQWTSEENSGFSSEKPWLPVHNNHSTLNVESQKQNSHSILNFYRELILLRKKKTALNSGEIKFLETDKDIISYFRFNKESKILVILNFSNKEKTNLEFNDTDNWNIILSTNNRKVRISLSKEFTLYSKEILIVEKVN